MAAGLGGQAEASAVRGRLDTAQKSVDLQWENEGVLIPEGFLCETRENHLRH